MNSQESLTDQLNVLYSLANKNGLYDAADWIKNTRESNKLVGNTIEQTMSKFECWQFWNGNQYCEEFIDAFSEEEAVVLYAKNRNLATSWNKVVLVKECKPAGSKFEIDENYNITKAERSYSIKL